MAKDPAFLFYPNDWMGGTMGMTFEEKGAYMELLILQFNRGHMTSHMIGQTIGHIWVNIQDKFQVDDDGKYYNPRLDEEKKKRQKFTESRRNNLYGNNQYTKNSLNNGGHINGHMTSHMENVNVNENESVINKKNQIPNFDEFKDYAFTNQPETDIIRLELKYKSWIENSWKDGNNKPIKNWRTKLLNTLPYVKRTTKDISFTEAARNW